MLVPIGYISLVRRWKEAIREEREMEIEEVLKECNLAYCTKKGRMEGPHSIDHEYYNLCTPVTLLRTFIALNS